MGRIYVFLVLFLAVPDVQAQRDSLINLLAASREDTNKVKLLLALESEFFNVDLDTALYYNTLSEKLILKLGAQSYKHTCFYNYVKIYHAKTDYKNSLFYCKKLIQVGKENKNKFQQAAGYRAIFNLYHNLRMNDLAIKYALYSLALTTEIGDTANVAANYGNLCWLYIDLEQLDKAITYGIKGVDAGKHYADTVGLLISINNLALCYIRTNDYQKAIALLKQQLEIGKRINRPRSIRNALINLGTSYYSIGDKDGLEKTTAQLNEFNRGVDLDSKSRSVQHIANANNYTYQKKFNLAEEHLYAALKIAEADSLLDQLLNVYAELSKIKFAQHDFAAGNFYENKWDSLTHVEADKKLSEFAEELETKYEVEKKSTKIMLQASQLKTKSVVNYLLIGAAICLLIILTLAYRSYLHKNKLQQQRIGELEKEKHLATLEAVLKGEEQERTRLAKDLHDGLGGMLSGIKYSFNAMKENLIMTPENQQAFGRSIEMLDSSINEMRRVAHNMMPESLVKFGLDTALNDFCSDINKSGALQIHYQSLGLDNEIIDQTTAITVYRIVQELINNTLKHAAATNAIIQVVKIENQISITVEDDGTGFDTAILTQSKGIGWTNIYHRVDLLKGTLDVNSQPEKGTSVHIEFRV